MCVLLISDLQATNVVFQALKFSLYECKQYLYTKNIIFILTF